MTVLRSSGFWMDAGERAIRTIAQALLALMGTDALGIVGLDWAQMGSVAVGAGIMSLLTAIVATGIGDKGTTQLLKEKR